MSQIELKLRVGLKFCRNPSPNDRFSKFEKNRKHRKIHIIFLFRLILIAK